jgi:lipoate-protein ligase A
MRTNSPSLGPESASATSVPAASVNEDLLALYAAGGKPVYRLYEPEGVSIVLGAGRSAAQDVFVERARADGVEILRRRGGGGTVVLSRGQLVLALVTGVASPFHNLQYFRAINHWFRRALEGLGVTGIEDRGISDLAIRERKILGTSMYRRRNLLFYQASLLVDLDLALFERYLAHPYRVPEYRQQRPHREFCTTLRLEGCTAALSEIVAELRGIVERELPRLR